MSETTAGPDSSARNGVSRTAVLVMILLVLALGAGTALVSQQMSELKGRVRILSGELERARANSRAQAAAVDTTFSPLVAKYVAAAQTLLDAGDEAGAKAELKHAQSLALSIKDLGTGNPPEAMVTALTDIENALGEPLTLPPPPPGAT